MKKAVTKREWMEGATEVCSKARRILREAERALWADGADEADFSDKKSPQIKAFLDGIRRLALEVRDFSPELASSIGGVFVGCTKSAKKAASSRENLRKGLARRWEKWREQKAAEGESRPKSAGGEGA